MGVISGHLDHSSNVTLGNNTNKCISDHFDISEVEDLIHFYLKDTLTWEWKGKGRGRADRTQQL